MYFLVESRNLKRHSIIQAKAAEENCERLLQEIARRERECSIIREHNQRERTKTKTQLREIQEKVYELQDRLDLTQNENKNLFEKLRKSEVEVDKLKVLNIRHAQEVDEKAMIIEKLSGQVASSEVKVQEREEQLRETSAKLIDNNLALKETTTKLEEVQEMLKEIEAQKNEFEAKQDDTEMGTENLKPEGRAYVVILSCSLYGFRLCLIANSQNIAIIKVNCILIYNTEILGRPIC